MAPALSLLLALALADDAAPPTLIHEELQVAVRDRPLVVEAQISDESGVFDPVVLWRVGSEGPFARAPLVEKSPGVYQATLPAAVIVGDVEYFIEAYDALGNGPARHGTEDLPVRVRLVAASGPTKAPTTEPGEVPAEEAESDDTALYVGLGLGGAAVVVVVVAAAAVAGVVAFVLLSPPPGGGDGKATLAVTAPTPISAPLSSSAAPLLRGAP